MTTDESVTTMQAAWNAHARDAHAALKVLDARRRNNARFARSLTSSGSCLCEPPKPRSAEPRLFIPVARGGDAENRLFVPEPLVYLAWRFDGPFSPMIEVVECADAFTASLGSLPLAALDVAFGPDSEILVLPLAAPAATPEIGKAPDASSPANEEALRRRDIVRRFVVRMAWETAGRAHAVRLSLPEADFTTPVSSPFGFDAYLRDRFVPLWGQGSPNTPRWLRLSVHELSTELLLQLQN